MTNSTWASRSKECSFGTFTAPEIMVTFKCDVHSWMNAYVGVLDHPYFAVTAEDGGFDISGLPPR